jgi:lipopolysaccharide biosynthesis regulator YciM
VSASEPWRNRAVDLRVENHRKPIDELQRLLRIHHAFFALEEAARALGEGRIDDARALAAEALRRGRAHDEVSFWVGIILARLGDEDAGVRALRSALRRNARLRSVLSRLPAAYRPPETVLRRVLLRHEVRRLQPRTAASS